MADIHEDESVAARYDEDSSDAFSEAVLGPTVNFLKPLAINGCALEFALGTGRVALPLSERGVEVSGIELSKPMLDQFRAKPGADRLTVVEGDMATTRVEGEFGLVYLVYNTIMNLTDQDQQVACFQNAARHLLPGGSFVVEVLVPRLRQLSPASRIQPFDIGDQHLGFDEYVDFSAQILKSHHYFDDEGQFRRYEGRFRWVWPSELDLMARVAGLTLSGRWANWQQQPFTEVSESHVSAWQMPG